MELAKIMYKAVSNSLPHTLESYFIRNQHGYNLRSSVTDPFRIDRTNTVQYRRWLTTAGVELWNALSTDTKNYHFFV